MGLTQPTKQLTVVSTEDLRMIVRWLEAFEPPQQSLLEVAQYIRERMLHEKPTKPANKQ